MAKIDKLIKAKKVINDEFYTQYADIQKEINAYLEFNPDTFRNKVVLLPCDDPEWSNFTRFFAQNFDNLGLKKLISTSYAYNSKNKEFRGPYQLTFFEEDNPKYSKEKSMKKGKIFILEKDVNNSDSIDIDDLEWDYLDEDGDFRSDEVTKLRDEADIIITNPPFSLLIPFVEWIFEGKKDFLIIANYGAITYKNIFPLIKDNKLWLGSGFHAGNAFFKIPSEACSQYDSSVYDEKTGLVKFRNCCWFTNLDHGRRHTELELMTMEENIKYSKHKEIRNKGYVKYDNYDAIEVNYYDAIPKDYDGIMGVSSSFFNNFCPEQFEIVACSQTGCHPDEMVLKNYKDYIGYKQSGLKTGRTGNTCGNNPMIEQNDGVHDYYMNADGKMVQSTNGRIFIRLKKQ